MEKYQEDNPNNCRVFIDYRKKKNPVTFEYVHTDRVFYIVFIPLWTAWLGINIIGYMIYMTISLIIQIETESLSYFTGFSSQFSLMDMFIPLGVIFWIGGIPFIVALFFLKYPKLIRLMPYLNSFMCGGSLEVVFTPKNTKTKTVEIPLFYNVRLDYEATKDFSKYLERFEIVEHPFEKILKNNKRRKCDSLWKATFYFSKVPKTGRLKVKWH